MAVWFRANKMAVNAEKTKYIIFHTKNKRVDPGNSVLVFDNNKPGQPYNDDLVTPLLRIQSNHPEIPAVLQTAGHLAGRKLITGLPH